jgi:ACS family sodium-dependent inorganic phosphate cotransporter
VGVLWWWFWHKRVDGNLRTPEIEKAPPLPPLAWSRLLRSMPVWAIIVGHFCNNWGGYVLLAWMPTYITQALGVDYAKVGLFSMVPALFQFLFLNVAGIVADKLIASGRDITRIRKTMQTIGFGGSALMLMFVGYVQDVTLAIAMMSLGGVIGSFASAGFAVNHLDIAPRQAGVVMGLSNTAATIPGIVGVTVSGWILQATGSWALVFQVAAGVYIAGLLFYLAFASSRKIFD